MPRSRNRGPGNPRIAIGYVRVSTDEQHLGPEAQRLALNAWATREGFALAAVFEDLGVSGAAPVEKRPGLLGAVQALPEYSAGLLVATKRDRLARDPMVTAMISALARSSGARALAIDDRDDDEDPMAILRRGIEDLFAQHERLVIKARTRAALAVKKSRNEFIGEARIGLRRAPDGVHLEGDEAEAAALARAFELRAEGKSIRTIASRLTLEGVPARGKAWHPTTVARLLNRAA